ncbi:ornithine carbamoyltransferase [Bartonella fuyuanensis]|uniref:Ornithine carbamoyltransferase n=1 Tax=Bartonella fuyuanensis TaxID=1460968 RepID=A0A840DZH0_9HYPH|nr:ornithine carbamoyltransferase [Bartonella fuyuanensis]MBB4075987.1 ornithine carbamoyltransferase [Bartonella fuyuanensis]
MKLAKLDALFMHYLSTDRSEEVINTVTDRPHTVIFDEVENCLHAQKAVFSWYLQDAFFSPQ